MFIGGLLFLVFVSLVGASLWAYDLPRPFYVHGIFALAALPLMWAAMLHFVPVLTRSREAPRAVRASPWLAMGLGVELLAVFAEKLPRHVLLLVALLVGGGALVLLRWAGQRSRQALGRPHPGVRWYLAALACLASALAAVFGMVLDPARYATWYGLHLHLNLLGWVGLTVLGTLPVLLPTCLSQWDSLRSSRGDSLRSSRGDSLRSSRGDSLRSQKIEPNATLRLQIGLPWAVFGVVAIAVAAALRVPVLGAFGGLALILVVAAHWRAWLSFYGAPWRWPGPGLSLLLGSGFLLVVFVIGIAHGFGLVGGAVLLPAFVAGFLLPTVLGALAQLLPVWRFPGPDSPARESFRQTLARGAGLRGGLCVLAGAGQLLALTPSLALAGVAVLWLLLAVVWALRPQSLRPSTGL